MNHFIPLAYLKKLPERSQSVEQCVSFENNLQEEGSAILRHPRVFKGLISDDAILTDRECKASMCMKYNSVYALRLLGVGHSFIREQLYPRPKVIDL
jgi:hypothetical protein